MTRSAQEIQDGIIDRISRLTGLAPEEIDPHAPVLRFGLDSVALVALTTEVEAWLGYRFRGYAFENHSTVAALARFLAEQVAKGG
jgi:acyl carrier protein